MATRTKTTTNGHKDTAAEKPSAAIVLQPLNLQRVLLPIIGESELIVHAWSEKAKRQMLDKQMNPGTRSKKEPKDPVADYEACFYRLPDGTYGLPSAAFKAAIVGACRLFDGLPMTQAKIAIRVHGEGQLALTRIAGEPYMREDMVRLETGVADVRYRPGFPEWAAELDITFNASLLNIESLVSLVNGAGQGGVGEWRPSAPKSSSGSFGTFRVNSEAL